MTQSMTGFSSGRGEMQGYSWSWEIRSVNAKGLDLRLRVPDWVPGLEAGLRTRLAATLARGNVTLSLRLGREEGASALRVNTAQLTAVLTALQQVEAQAMAQGVDLAPSRASDLLGQRGVLETTSTEDEITGLPEALLADFEPVLRDFQRMRGQEGAALAAVLGEQLDQIGALILGATEAAIARQPRLRAQIDAALARVTEAQPGQDPQRIAQELALIAIKADVTEELDRLRGHVEAARLLLAQDGAIGRKLDFLMQEFNREANTLCSKAQDPALSAIGLELKAVIDQMREQVQNVE